MKNIINRVLFNSFSTLIAKKKIIINPMDLEWSYARGSGPGGQKVNKTNNMAILLHKPS